VVVVGCMVRERWRLRLRLLWVLSWKMAFKGGFWNYCFLYSIIGVESERGIAKYQ